MATKVTSVGRDWMVDKLDGTVATKMEYIGWGTGAGTTAIGDTTLFTESAETRVGGSGSGVTLSQPASDTNRAVGTLTASTTRAITNAATFTAVSSGTIGTKGDFTTVNLLTGDSITFTIDSQLTTS